MNTNTKLYSFTFLDARTYLLALLFIAGNILLPRLCHFIPSGGLIFLPIYFFTLIGAYKYGLSIGLLTALCSPLINHLCFGMPPADVLPIILIKSGLLAVFAAYGARYAKSVSLLVICLIVLSYQVAGTGIEWIITGSFMIALGDFRIGLPGMLIQIFGGYALIRAISRL